MAREVASPQRQAEILKDQGNMFFKKDRLAAAIEAYTEVFLLLFFFHFDIPLYHAVCVPFFVGLLYVRWAIRLLPLQVKSCSIIINNTSRLVGVFSSKLTW